MPKKRETPRNTIVKKETNTLRTRLAKALSQSSSTRMAMRNLPFFSGHSGALPGQRKSKKRTSLV